MTKKQKFIEAVQAALFDVCDPSEMDKDILDYWNAFKGQDEADKPLFTDNGKLVLTYMRENMETGKARDIGEGLYMNSRAVSGALRKLVSDGFVEKIGADPVIYSVTEKGKTVEIN